MEAMAAVRQKTTVIEILDWAFRRQRAHVLPDVGSFDLHAPRDSCAKLEAMRGIMGCRIDGGQWKELGHRVHPDAVAVVAAVGSLPDWQAALVGQYARAGSYPDWGEVCRVWPVRRDNGKVMVLREDVTIVNRRGFTSTVTVSYCPFDIFPNVDYCREEWCMWWDGLAALAVRLRHLKRWDVGEVGVEREPWII